MPTEVVVAGGGIVGLCTAVALAERMVDVTLVSSATPGEASAAAAAMLAPSVERARGSAHDFAVAARDRYPEYLKSLAEKTGIRVDLNREGILQVAIGARGLRGLRKSASPQSAWLDASQLAALEPALSHALGAVHNPLDGAVDNVALLQSLGILASGSPRISQVTDRVVSIGSGARAASVTTAAGQSIESNWIVIAAGAWSGRIQGARLARVVAPIKGQLISYSSRALRHATYGPRGYLVPRGDVLIAGSTMEQTGFDSSVSDVGIARIRMAAEEILPELKEQQPTRAWGGLRPVTPDMLPLLGPDPGSPRILYACGHGRNGVLMGPLTGDIIADLVTGSPLRHDLEQFRPDRF